MEARELRIGNWIEYKGNPVKWGKSDFCEPNASIFENPIPLTEEWLLKFGLVGNYYFDIKANRKKITFTWSSRVVSTGVRSGFRSSKYPHIKYVHQLQNLFYALTGEEL